MAGRPSLRFSRAVLFYHTPLQPLQQRTLEREILGLTDLCPETQYEAGDTLLVWVAVLLNRLPFIDAEKWRLLLGESRKYFAAVGKALEKQINKPAPGLGTGDGQKLGTGDGVQINLCQLVFIDGRYVTWGDPAQPGFIDMASGDRVLELEFPGLESVAYNIHELARREQRRCLTVQAHLAGTSHVANKD